MGTKFTLLGNSLIAVWADRYTMTVRVLPEDILSTRMSLAKGYPIELITALHERCNWWNESRTSLKASAQDRPFHTSNADTPRPLMAGLNLGIELPCKVGIAPVQLQSLVENLLGNVHTFETETRLDVVRLEPS